jgi:hypothetical protein
VDYSPSGQSLNFAQSLKSVSILVSILVFLDFFATNCIGVSGCIDSGVCLFETVRVPFNDKIEWKKAVEEQLSKYKNKE